MRNRNRGFSLLELMIALVILAIGLLSSAKLTVANLQNQHSAYSRTQASALAHDLAERMRGNPSENGRDANYAARIDTHQPPADPGCFEERCNATQQAQRDLHQWAKALGVALPEAIAQISRTDGPRWHIQIEWREAYVANRTAQTEPRSLSLVVEP